MAAVAVTGIMSTATPALADETVEPGNPEVTTVVFSGERADGAETTLPQAYSEGDKPSAASESAKSDFIDKVSDESGLYYDPNALDYLKLEPAADTHVDPAEMVVPEDYHVDEVKLEGVTVTTNDGDEAAAMGASVEGSSDLDAAEVALPDGPGFISFTPSGSGQYILKMTKGEMLATWAKARMTGDDDSTYDYWQYQRKAKVESYDVPGLNWFIHEFGIKSYPAAANPLHHWVDWAPSIGAHDGDCNGKPVTIEVGFEGAVASTSFQDCDTYTAYMRNNSPGDFSVNWNPPWNSPAGRKDPRETAFTWIAARKQPSTTAAQKKMTVMDYQYFRMAEPKFGNTIWTCQSTNGGINC